MQQLIRGLLAVIAIGAATAAPAQQPDPAQAFAKEWGVLQAADVLAASAHAHVAELAQQLVQDYQRQREELAKAKADNAALESRLATAMQWLQAAQREKAGPK